MYIYTNQNAMKNKKKVFEISHQITNFYWISFHYSIFMTEFEAMCTFTYDILEFSHYILAKSRWWKLEIGYGFNHLAIRIPNTSPVTQWAKNGKKVQ